MAAVSPDGRYVYFQYEAADPSSYAGHDDITQGAYQIKRLDLVPELWTTLPLASASNNIAPPTAGPSLPKFLPMDAGWRLRGDSQRNNFLQGT